MIRFNCPSCSKSFKAADNKAGTPVRCTNCAQPFLIPPPVSICVTTKVRKKKFPILTIAVGGILTVLIAGSVYLRFGLDWDGEHKRNSDLTKNLSDIRQKHDKREAERLGGYRPTDPATKADVTQKRSRSEFRALMIGKSMSQVLKLVGKPRNTVDLGEEKIWYYGPGLSYDPVTGNDDNLITIIFQGSTVEKVLW